MCLSNNYQFPIPTSNRKLFWLVSNSLLPNNQYRLNQRFEIVFFQLYCMHSNYRKHMSLIVSYQVWLEQNYCMNQKLTTTVHCVARRTESHKNVCSWSASRNWSLVSLVVLDMPQTIALEDRRKYRRMIYNNLLWKKSGKNQKRRIILHHSNATSYTAHDQLIISIRETSLTSMFLRYQLHSVEIVSRIGWNVCMCINHKRERFEK